MLRDSRIIGEAYTTQVPQQPAIETTAVAQENQEEVKKRSGIKDWIRLPHIDTPFKARMAAVLIVELINNLSKTSQLRDLVLKEIKTSNRLHKRIS